jgi:hypothetical protein
MPPRTNLWNTNSITATTQEGGAISNPSTKAWQGEGRTQPSGRAERAEAGDGSVGEAGGGAAEVLEDAAVQIGYLSLQLLRLRLRLVLSGCGGGRSLALALVGRGSILPWLERTASHGGFCEVGAHAGHRPGPTKGAQVRSAADFSLEKERRVRPCGRVQIRGF